MKFLSCLLITQFLVGLLSAQEIFDWDGKPLKEVQLETVRFRGWIPSGEAPLRGTLVLIPGRHGDGRGLATNADWQQFAEEMRFALMGCQFSEGDPGLYQSDEKGEVCKAIDEALVQFSELSGQKVLAKGPLLFWGSSAGSNVSSRYCSRTPGRVIAFGSSKGTWGPGSNVSVGATKVPMFFAVGAKDKPDWVEFSLKSIEDGVRKHAPWVLAYHPTEGHGVGRSLEPIRAFFKAAIRLRMPTNTFSGSTASSGSNLQRMPTANSWLGDPDSYEVAASAAFRGKRSKAIWLPDEETALAWQAYLKN